MKQQLAPLKIKFVAKLGIMGKYEDGEEKFHIIVPKQYVDQVRNLKGKQVKMTLEDEL